MIFFRKIESEVLKSAGTVGKVRTTTLVARIRERILKSEYPKAVIHMRKIDALRQVPLIIFLVIRHYLHNVSILHLHWKVETMKEAFPSILVFLWNRSNGFFAFWS